MKHLILAVFASLLLTGCTAFHSLPPRGYASLPADAGAARLILDQNGDPWPEGTSADAVLPDSAGNTVLNKARAFRLADRLAKARLPYDRDGALDRVAAQIASHSEPAGRVVILVRGFDNSFDSFRAKYSAMRAWLAAEGSPPARYLDVYWDALHRGNEQAGYPFGRFVRSRSNAERAGRCGLRELLARLPAGTDVTVISHSLGAEVALAALADRPAGRGEVSCGKRPAPAVPSNLGDVRLVAFAPAVGRVQLLDPEGRVTRRTLGAIDRFYLGFNPNDPAVTKHNKGVNLPDWLGGDTRLGGNRRFVASLDAKLDRLGLADAFQTIAFEQPDHAMAQYLNDKPRARCLMWAGGLLPAKPEGCALSR